MRGVKIRSKTRRFGNKMLYDAEPERVKPRPLLHSDKQYIYSEGINDVISLYLDVISLKFNRQLLLPKSKQNSHNRRGSQDSLLTHMGKRLASCNSPCPSVMLSLAPHTTILASL